MAESISNIDAQIADLQRQRDIAELEGGKAVKAGLNAGKVATFEADMKALQSQVSSSSEIGRNLNAMISCIESGRLNIDREIARIQAIVDAQTGAAAE